MLKDRNSQSRFPRMSLIQEEILCVIAERGGSIKIRDGEWSIFEELANRFKLSDEARTRMTTEKYSEIAWKKRVRQCRRNLAKAGFVEQDKVSGQGIWTLTNL